MASAIQSVTATTHTQPAVVPSADTHCQIAAQHIRHGKFRLHHQMFAHQAHGQYHKAALRHINTHLCIHICVHITTFALELSHLIISQTAPSAMAILCESTVSRPRPVVQLRLQTTHPALGQVWCTAAHGQHHIQTSKYPCPPDTPTAGHCTATLKFGWRQPYLGSASYKQAAAAVMTQSSPNV